MATVETFSILKWTKILWMSVGNFASERSFQKGTDMKMVPSWALVYQKWRIVLFGKNWDIVRQTADPPQKLWCPFGVVKQVTKQRNATFKTKTNQKDANFESQKSSALRLVSDRNCWKNAFKAVSFHAPDESVESTYVEILIESACTNHRIKDGSLFINLSLIFNSKFACVSASFWVKDLSSLCFSRSKF